MKWTLLILLLACSDAPIAAENKMYLNHFFVTVDSKTFAAIESDAFLKEQFAPFEKRTTVRTDMTYTGAYFYGDDTYFEFFDVAAGPIGTSGVAFGVEHPGDIQALQKGLGPLKTQFAGITRRWNDVDHPWFFLLAPAEDTPLQVWVMEYDPQFLVRWHPEEKTPSSDISRATILSRYKAVLSQVPEHPLLQNVASLTIAVDGASRSMLEQFAISGGFAKENDSLKGPGVVLQMVEATPEYNGIIKIEFSLNREPADQQDRIIGNSRLEFPGGKRATWHFYEKKDAAR